MGLRSVRPENEASFGAVVREVAQSIQKVVRSEIRLAQVELKHTTKLVSRHVMLLAIGGFIALLGVFPILAFLCVGLGRLLGDNFWLSSLIVGVVFLIVGGVVALAAYGRMKSDDFKMSRVRESLNDDKDIVNRKLTEIKKDVNERRAA